MPKKLSFIIPTRNEEKILEPMLLSLRKLHTVPYEIIVSDGGSTDGTLPIANRLADKVVVHSGQARQNIAGGKNAGAAAASGDFYVFIDADVFVPEMDSFFADALKRFADDQKLIGLIPQLKVLPDLQTLADRIFLGYFNFFNFLMNNILHKGAAPGEFQMMPASVFKWAGGYDEKLPALEDMDLFIRLLRFGKTRFDYGLTVYQTGRRAHKIGWIRLSWLWASNALMVRFFKRSASKEWKVIR